MDTLLRVPSLQAMQALVQVAKTRSFTDAARQLHLTQSAISRQVQQLEEHYGAQLFERSNRKVELTEAGCEVYAVAQEMLEKLLQLEERLAPATQERPFRIRIFVSLAVRWLLPRLNSFYAQHPELCLSVESIGGELLDNGGDSDAYVLYLPDGIDPLGRDLIPLYDEYLVPVCAPILDNGQPPPRSLGELAGHAIIHPTTDRQEWKVWLSAQADATPTQLKHITFNLDDLALDAASRGLGVTVIDYVLAHDALQRGDLIVPFGEPLKTGSRYAICLRDRGAAHPACQAVLNWFEQQRNALQS